jgi:hypothetical protein
LPETIRPDIISSLRSSILILIDAPSHPDCRATPHIGYVAENLYRTFYGDASISIGAWLDEIADSNQA